MSNRISPEHMAEIKAMTRGVLPSQLLEHIAALEAEVERLRNMMEVACEFILATPPCGRVWIEHRNAVLDMAVERGMWKRPHHPALAALEAEAGE